MKKSCCNSTLIFGVLFVFLQILSILLTQYNISNPLTLSILYVFFIVSLVFTLIMIVIITKEMLRDFKKLISDIFSQKKEK
ncbi:hypothetical protein CYQ67_07430 [Enterococcus faecium]|nr:hypothetical protein DKP90_13485 [Enterococcus faecium]RXW77181.1 hypothetical protein CYQ67_07430 [Enterococcus faecium]RXW96650.1 hypothetical protein CYQ59_04665 [Enterococcus faecium]